MGKAKREARDAAGPALTGRIGCKNCKSVRGQFIKAHNQFICETAGCPHQRREHRTVTVKGEIETNGK